MRDDAGAQVVAPTQPSPATGATIPLTGVAAPGSKLVAVLGFTGDGATTAKVKNLTATYTTTTTPSQLTLTAGKTLLPYGGSTTLSGKLVSDPTPHDAANGDALPLGGQEVDDQPVRRRHDGLHGDRQGHDRPSTAPSPCPIPSSRRRRRATAPCGPAAPSAAVTYPPAAATVRVQVKPKVTLALTKYNTKSGKYFLYKLRPDRVRQGRA